MIMEKIIIFLNEYQYIYGLCPCCHEIFKLSECKMQFPSLQKKDDPFFQLKQFEKQVDNAYSALEKYDEKSNRAIEEAQKRARKQGQLLAKRNLKKIDPIFSGRNIDPQDVKTIFDPVEFVVFNNMNSEYGQIKDIEFICLNPKSKKKELAAKSVSSAIKKGNIEFVTIRVAKDGTIDTE